jgi:clan AA aspartic protease (TIGR02281 family)
VSNRLILFLVGMLISGAAIAQTPQPAGAPCGPVKINGQTRYPGEIWRDGQGEVHALPNCPLPPGAAPPPVAAVTQSKPTTLRVPIQKRGRNYVVSGIVNNAVTLTFMVDSGASDVTIPADAIATLKSAGALSDRDFTGKEVRVLADGSKITSDVFRIRSLSIGDWLVHDVNASVTPAGALPLLGQAFFNRLKSWSIDNVNQTLVLDMSR